MSITSLESLINSAYLDFEITGKNAVKSSMEPGILGLLVREHYVCLILDERLSSIAELFPKYCIYDSNMNHKTNVQDWIFDVDEDVESHWLWTWSERDIEWYFEYVGSFSEIGLRPVNALSWVRKPGRKRGLRKLHSLEKYMLEVGHKFPNVGYASNIIKSLREYHISEKNIDDYYKKAAFNLLLYNYHDCFGMREVMLNMFDHESPFSPDRFFRC